MDTLSQSENARSLTELDQMGNEDLRLHAIACFALRKTAQLEYIAGQARQRADADTLAKHIDDLIRRSTDG